MFGLDAIAAPPISMGILHIVEEDDQVCVMDKVEVAFPRKIIGLIDDNTHCWCENDDLRQI